MLSDGKKLSAVKYTREVLGIGLKEAKTLVESLEDESTGSTKMIIGGENENLLIELTEDDQSEFDDIEEVITESESELNEGSGSNEVFIASFEETEDIEEPELSDDSVKKKKKVKTRKKESEPITFSKVANFDKMKKRSRSNSGCLLSLTLMIALLIILAVGLLY
jgi:hypothetical protein